MAERAKTPVSDIGIDLILILLKLLYLGSQVSPYGQLLRTKQADRQRTPPDKGNCCK